MFIKNAESQSIKTTKIRLVNERPIFQRYWLEEVREEGVDSSHDTEKREFWKQKEYSVWLGNINVIWIGTTK